MLWKCLEHDGKINGLTDTKNDAEARINELTERLDKLEGQLNGGFFARLFGKRK